MRMINLLAVLGAVVLTGCGTTSMTSAEFRATVKKDHGNIDSMTVNRSLGEVTQALQKMSKECLNFDVTQAIPVRSGFGHVTNMVPYGVAKGTVLVSPKQTELRLQRKIKDQIGKIPEDGMYFLVADVTPAAANKTNVTIYYDNDVKEAATAIKGWASGSSRACPDPGHLF